MAAEKAIVVRLNTYRRNIARIMKMWKLDELNEIDALVHQSSKMDSSFKQEHGDSNPSTGGGAAIIFSIPREDGDE